MTRSFLHMRLCRFEALHLLLTGIKPICAAVAEPCVIARWEENALPSGTPERFAIVAKQEMTQ